ncbi:WXG100 family type VII secretion target [Nocardia beijingensis]|uniref:WXG100 family type VII secretion target n=1 Tax=Nocardia beijingensis TaxID=95162 RepID=UPI003324D7F5
MKCCSTSHRPGRAPAVRNPSPGSAGWCRRVIRSRASFSPILGCLTIISGPDNEVDYLSGKSRAIPESRARAPTPTSSVPSLDFGAVCCSVFRFRVGAVLAFNLVGQRFSRCHARSTLSVGLCGGRGGRGLVGEQPSLSVDADAVEALGRLAFDVATQCRDGYSALEIDVRDMLESWTGSNAGAFAAGWEEFHQGAVQVWDALFELAEKLESPRTPCAAPINHSRRASARSICPEGGTVCPMNRRPRSISTSSRTWPREFEASRGCFPIS